MSHVDIHHMPLQFAWTMFIGGYIGPNHTTAEYVSALDELCQFHTVKDFWSWFNNIPKASELKPGRTYHLMKTGIFPVWEDRENENGGTIVLRFAINEIDEAWQSLCLLTIGGLLDNHLSSIDSHDKVCGISVGMRTNEAVLSIWNASASTFAKNKIVPYIVNIVKPQQCKQTRSQVIKATMYQVHRQLENFGH